MKVTKNDLRDSSPATAAHIQWVLLNLLERIESLEQDKTLGEIHTPLGRVDEHGVWYGSPGEVVITNENTIEDVLRHLIEECNGDSAEVASILDWII